MKIRIRGFRLKYRVTRLFRISRGYHRLNPRTSKSKTVSRVFSCLKTTAKSLCSSYLDWISDRIYVPMNKSGRVPKGKLAVYVGQKDGDFHRVLVPLMYFKHPLFEDLLREAEKEYGFDHPGGITIPCPFSEFEGIKTRVAAGFGSRRLLWK